MFCGYFTHSDADLCDFTLQEAIPDYRTSKAHIFRGFGGVFGKKSCFKALDFYPFSHKTTPECVKQENTMEKR